MQREYKYREGEQAKKNFDHAMKKLFRAPKTVRVGGASSAARKSAKKSEREGKSE